MKPRNDGNQLDRKESLGGPETNRQVVLVDFEQYRGYGMIDEVICDVRGAGDMAFDDDFGGGEESRVDRGSMLVTISVWLLIGSGSFDRSTRFTFIRHSFLRSTFRHC
jgi:hypothetical protein